MADDVAITAGSGTNIATDQVAGLQHYQRVKITDGTADSTTHLKVVAEDAAHTSGDTGIVAMAVRQDTAASLSGTDADYNPLITDASGRLHVNVGTGSLSTVSTVSTVTAVTSITNPVTVNSHAVTNAGTFATQSAITAASGSIASGAIASGAVASGAFASGSIASGAIAAGAIATGATSIAANEDDASASGDTGVKMLVKRADTPAATSGTDGDYEPLQVSGGKLWTNNLGNFATVSTDITRPADTNAYAVDDCWSDSTTVPTTGGFTFTSAARKSGGSGIITDAIFTTSNDAATLLQGELWVFNTSVTAINDNAAFAVSDSEIKTVVAKIPFSMVDAGNNGFYHAQNLSIGFTASGSANLRFLIRVKNAYTPASAEVLTCVLKIIQVD